MTFVVAPTAAGASTALCGATITVSTTLTEDVGPCPNNGITIGASNITLNLAGHTVFGTPSPGDGIGIQASNVSGITVRGGTVRDFDAGVVFDHVTNGLITQIQAKDNIGEQSEALSTDFGDGILLFESSNNRVIQNVADHNGPFDGIGLLGNSDNNLIQGNVVQNNNLNFQREGHGTPEDIINEDDGIRLETTGSAANHRSPNFNTVTGNTVRNNGLDGIAAFPFADDNTISNNVFDHNGYEGIPQARRGDGIHIFGRVMRTTVTGNRVTYNARNGIRIDPTVANPVPALNNVVTRNVSVYNGQAPGLDPAFDLSDGNRFCDSNTWTQNTHITEDDPGTDCLN
jgi:hypothetical protein